jgi:predicted phosphodiesterase
VRLNEPDGPVEPSDVHGNVSALTGELDELSSWRPDLVVFCGDLTWGCEPDQTIDLVRDLPAVFVRGNSERAVVEFARGTREPAPAP